MRAARYHGQRDVRVEEVDPEPVGPDELRIDVAACGICGSDLHEYAEGPIFVPDGRPHPLTGETLPVTMGHEFGGRVSETGGAVEGLSVGDAVAVNPLLSCGDCRYCAEGSYHLCESVGFIGLAGGGGFAESVVVPADHAVPFPDGVPIEHAALVEPLSVALHAVRGSGLREGDAVAVFGSGPIGLGVVQAVRAAGAGEVFVSEPREARRERAALSGADVLIDPRTADPVDRITDATGGGVDVAFEVAGVSPTLTGALRSTKRGGRVTVVSIFEEAAEVQPNDIVLGERTVTGTLGYLAGPLGDREFGMTIRKLADGAFDPEPLVTDRIDLDDIGEGFEALLDEGSDQVKILVSP